MNIRIRAIFRIICAFFILLTFKGFIYRSVVKYKMVESRKEYKIEVNNLKNIVNNCVLENELSLIEDIIDISLSKTAQHLEFTSAKSSENPNEIIKTKKTNCIGYSNFFTIICNELIEKNKLNNWNAVTCKGRLYFLGIDIHSYLSSPFFKYHDFVLITNKSTNETIAVDPSLYDYLRIGQVKYLR